MQPCSTPTPPSQIQSGVDRLLDEIFDAIRRGMTSPFASAPPPNLSPEFRQVVRADLLRAPVAANAVGEVCYRDFRYFHNQLTVVFHLTRLFTAVRFGVFGVLSSALLGGGEYRAASYAGTLYLALVDRHSRAVPESPAFVSFVTTFVSPTVFSRDDVDAMHRALLDVLEYTRFPERDERLRRALVVVSNILYEPSWIGSQLGLGVQVDKLGLNWRELAYEIERGLSDRPQETADTLATRFLELIRERIDADERRRFGEGSRAAREAVDRLESGQRQLSPGCAMWTYEELEHWARALLESATVPRLCEIARTQKSLLRALGDVEIDEPCEEVPRDELVDLLRRAIRRTTKRSLCALLAAYTTPPAVVRWASQQWYNLEARSDYLAPDVVAQLLTEHPTLNESLDYDEGEQGTDVFLYTLGPDGEFGHNVEGSNFIRGYVGWDLARKLFRDPFTGEIQHLLFEIERHQLSRFDAARPIGSLERHEPGSWWCAIVVVRGLLLVSAVTTNQITRRVSAETLIVEREEMGTPLPPQQLALLPGDVLIANLGETAVRDGAITPFDEDAFYDMLVLRAGEDGTVWFEFHLAS